MGKKGYSEVTLVAVFAVLAILGLVFILPLFGKTKAYAENLTDYRICKDGNRAVVLTRLKAFDWVIAEQGVKHCKTEKVKVQTGKEYEAIAKKMAQCWDQYLEGKEELFETQDNNYCAFCSVLEFEDKTKKLNELSKYLVNNKLLNSEETYIGYLSEIDAKGDDKTKLENMELKNNVFIDTSNRLAVMYVMYKDAYPGVIGQPRTLTFIGGAAAGAATAAAVAFGRSNCKS